jgi:autotransporter-associated beta strand protein
MKRLNFVFFIIFLWSYTSFFGADTTWKGTDSVHPTDLFTIDNWTAGIPIAGSNAIFSSSASSFAPTIDSAHTLTAQSFTFSDKDYHFYLGQGITAGNITLTDGGILPAATPVSVIFDLINSSKINFVSSLAPCTSGKTTINATASTVAYEGLNVNASDTTINLIQGGILELHGAVNVLSVGQVTCDALSGMDIADAGTHYTLKMGALNLNSSIDGLIDGVDGNIIKTGTGKYTFTNVNTYTGTTTISQGTLSIASKSNINATTGLIFDNGTLELNNPVSIASFIPATTCVINTNATFNTLQNDVTLDFTISGAGSLTKTGPGMIIITDPLNSYTGGTIISQGTVHIDDTSLSTGGITFNNLGGILICDNINPMTLSNAITLSTSGTFNTINAAVNLSGAITGVSSLTKTGAGTLILSGSNTYSGGTLVSTGILQGNSISLQRDITDNASVVFNQTTPGTYSGNISGTGSFVLQGGSTLTLSGTNTYSGGTTINAGSTLQGNTTSLQGNIADNGGLVFYQVTNGTYEGVLSGAGALTKTGVSEVNLTGNNNGFTGSTIINQGTLAINNNFNGPITVSGGTLVGVGPINNSVTLNTGSISPGYYLGTLTINGNYIQNNGFLDVNTTNSGQSDLLQVFGNITLGGLVDVTPSGGYQVGSLYKFLHYTGTITNTFNGTTIPNIFSILYDTVNKDIYLQANATQFLTNARTYNQMQVARQFDTTITFSEELAGVVEALELLSIKGQQEALDLLSGEQFTSLMYLSEDSSQRFLNKIYYPLAKRVSKNCIEPCGENFNVWMEGEGGYSNQKGDSNALGYHAKDWNITLGLHKCINDYFSLGILGTYERDHVNYKLPGKDRVESFLLGSFASLNCNRCYFLSEFFGGINHHEIERYIRFGSIDLLSESSPDVSQVVWNNEFGLNFYTHCFEIKPYVAFEYGYYKRDSIQEKNASPVNLQIESKNINVLNGFLGFHCAGSFFNHLIIGADFSYERRFNHARETLHLQFADFGQEFKIRGYKRYRNVAHISLDLNENCTENFSIFTSFNQEIANQYYSYNVWAGFSFKW